MGDTLPFFGDGFKQKDTYLEVIESAKPNQKRHRLSTPNRPCALYRAR